MASGTADDENHEELPLEELIEQASRSDYVLLELPSEHAHRNPRSLALRLLQKLPAVSAGAVSSALSGLDNPWHAPAVIGPAAYFLTETVRKAVTGSGRMRSRAFGREDAAAFYDAFFGLKGAFSAVAAGAAFVISAADEIFTEPLREGFFPFYADLLPLATSELVFTAFNGVGAYILLSGIERLLHPDSLATFRDYARHLVELRKGRAETAAGLLENVAAVPHSPKKAGNVLLRMGDLYMETGNTAGALSAYGRMLKLVNHADYFGISDWAIQGGARQAPAAHAPDAYDNVQAAMHAFAGGDIMFAHELLARAVAREPTNRGLRRIRALFFGATGREAEATLEMRVCSSLLRQEPETEFVLVGESRNEVLADPDGMLFVKRSSRPESLDEEVRNIEAFSEKLPGRLPRVLSLGKKNGYHYVELEAMGGPTMLQKARNGTLSATDVRQTLDFLVEVICAGQELVREGRISLSEPIAAKTYTYSNADVLREHNLEPVQPNFTEEGLSLFFPHRITDLFIIGVQKANGVEFSDDFVMAVQDGACLLGLPLAHDSSMHFVYTDFTHRNIMFESMQGLLAGKIDWEQIRKMPVFYEMINVLEFFQPNLLPVPYHDISTGFVNRLAKRLGIRINWGQLILEYEAAGVLRNLELIGYRSRDSAANPENIQAQVYHHLLARMHLVEAIRLSGAEAKPLLESMLVHLEQTPILGNPAEQKEIELGIRRQLIPSSVYLGRELRQLDYWREALGFSDMRQVLREPAEGLVTKTDAAAAASLLLGIPSAAASVLAYTWLTYHAMQRIMPAL